MSTGECQSAKELTVGAMTNQRSADQRLRKSQKSHCPSARTKRCFTILHQRTTGESQVRPISQ
ncbi:hypothetical protein HAX54_033444, partial [Datura stramonium]|nr:hypothetical protein [Datura stramonium]